MQAHTVRYDTAFNYMTATQSFPRASIHKSRIKHAGAAVNLVSYNFLTLSFANKESVPFSFNGFACQYM